MPPTIAAGDRATWLATDLPNKIEHELTHPIFASLIDLLEKLTAIGPPRTALDALLHEVLDDTNTDAFATMRTGNADLIQLAVDDPDTDRARATPSGACSRRTTCRRSSGSSASCTLRTPPTRCATSRRACSRRMQMPTRACARSSAVVDGVGDVDRPMPSPEPAWTAADYAAAFQGVADFLTETQHGLPRFIAIVKGRSLP